MAASSSASPTTPTVDEKTLPHYVIVCKGHWRGVMKVEVGQTVRTFKDQIVKQLRRFGSHPAIDVGKDFSVDHFQLRPGAARDIILSDTQLIHSAIPYKFMTPTVYLVMLDEHGDAMPIEDPPIAPPRHYSNEEMDALKLRIRADIDAKYACIE